MTRKETKELLLQNVVPIFIGNNARAHRLAGQLFYQYGIVSILCGKRKNLLDLLDPSCVFVKLLEKDLDRLTLEQLSDLANEYKEYLLFLIPVSSEGIRFSHENSDFLEASFILSDPQALLSQAPFRGFFAFDQACPSDQWH